MKQKNYKETEKAWIASLYLWQKRNLLVISSPKGPREKEFALDLQRFLQNRLLFLLKNQEQNWIDLSIERIEELANHKKLLPPIDFKELYRITFDIRERPEREKEEDAATLGIISNQRKFAKNTKEIHQRKNWSPI